MVVGDGRGGGVGVVFSNVILGFCRIDLRFRKLLLTRFFPELIMVLIVPP